MQPLPQHHSIHSQRGVALIMSLIILLILTIIGVQGMQTSIMEERMAGNFKDKRMAFESAEAGLQAAEIYLNIQTSPPIADSSASNGVYTFGTPNIRNYEFWQNIPNQNGLKGVAEGPRYVIEERGKQAGSGSSQTAEIGSISKTGTNGSTYGYRITARGVGGTDTAVVILQSDYEKVF